MSRPEIGHLQPNPNNLSEVTPLARFFVEHPREATAVVATIAGLATGTIAASLATPALTNFVNQISLILDK